MSTEKVVKAVETAIVKVSRDINKKKGAVGVDKLNSLARLINSYNRLLERTKQTAEPEPPNESYHNRLERECLEESLQK